MLHSGQPDSLVIRSGLRLEDDVLTFVIIWAGVKNRSSCTHIPLDGLRKDDRCEIPGPLTWRTCVFFFKLFRITHILVIVLEGGSISFSPYDSLRQLPRCSSRTVC